MNDEQVMEVEGPELLESTVLLVLNDMGFSESLSKKVIGLMSEEEKCSVMNRHMHSLLRDILQL
ncbi:hypothetical protein PS732_00695 [Pseudomonas fluorescens]|uniref:Uncharacterized protein n=1 Tax=Pseudomonas fluorescens TaxID=294 RepID=A0ABD7VB66_PSEFL|nr:hypothetical protein PS732_00695 [Pseudomonas fluorescens]